MQLYAFAAIITALILAIIESRGLFRLVFIIALICGIGSWVVKGNLGNWMFISSGILAILCTPWLIYLGYNFFGRGR
jgi:hypothetical protein